MNEPVLEVSDLAFRYPGARAPLFESLALSVQRGEMVAARGPSGCGKSTLLYVLGLFLRPDHGQILVNGRETGRLTDEWRSHIRANEIGFVFQDAALHPGETIEENVAEGAVYAGLGYSEARTHARSLLNEFGIIDLATSRPTQVSGGQAARAALCRALIRRPSLLLADEPTGNLDPENAAVVLAGLRSVTATGGGVVVVTHSQAVADASDRVVVLA